MPPKPSSGISDQAITELNAAQQSAGRERSNQHLIWAKLGEAYDLAGRNDDAMNAYQQAITAKPDVPGYYNNLGNVQARAGKIDDARASYTKSPNSILPMPPPRGATSASASTMPAA